MPTKREQYILEERRRAQLYAQASIAETLVDKNGKKIEGGGAKKLAGRIPIQSFESTQLVKKKKLGGNPKEILKNRAKKMGRIVDTSNEDSDSSNDESDLTSIRIAKKPSMSMIGGSNNTSALSNGGDNSGRHYRGDRGYNMHSSSRSSSNVIIKDRHRNYRDFSNYSSSEQQNMEYDPYEEKYVTNYNVEKGIADDSTSSKYRKLDGMNSNNGSNGIDSNATENLWLERSNFIKMFKSHDELDEFYKTGWILPLQSLGAKRKLL